MYELFLSYGHADRERALALFRALKAAGRTVWIDHAPRTEKAPEDHAEAHIHTPVDADHSAAFVGVPAGQRHRDVIHAVILDSATFLVCDSEAWRESTYCQEELNWAQEAGRRIAIVELEGAPSHLRGIRATEATVASLLQSLDQNAPLAMAQVRVDRARLGIRSTPSWLSRWLGRPDRADDAALLLTAGAGLDEPRVTPEQQLFAREVLSDDADRRTRRRRLTAGAVSVLTALTVAAVVSGLNASRAATASAASQRRAVSLDLASRSLATSGTAALTFARRAWETDQNDASAEAMAIAIGAQRQLREFQIGADVAPHQVVAITDGGWLISRGSSFLVFNSDGSRRHEVSTPRTIKTMPIISAGTSALVLADTPVNGSRALIRYDTRGDVPVESAVAGATALGEGPDGEVWLARGGAIGRYFPDSDTFEMMTTVRGTVTALSRHGGDLVVLTKEGQVLALEVSSAGFPVKWTQNLGSMPVSPSSVEPYLAQAPDQETGKPISHTDLSGIVKERNLQGDRVIWCNDAWHILLRSGSNLALRVAHVALADGKPIGPVSSQFGIMSAACDPRGGLVGTGPLFTRLQAFAPGQGVPDQLVTPDDRQAFSAVGLARGRLTVADSNGRLRVEGPTPSVMRNVGSAQWFSPVEDGILVQDFVGGLWFIRGNEPARSVGRFEGALGTPLVARGVTLTLSDSKVYRVTPEGLGALRTLPEVPVAASMDPQGTFSAFLLSSNVHIESLEAGAARTSQLPSLRNGESLIDISLSRGVLYGATSEGRVVRWAEDGTVTASWDSGVASRILLAPRPGEHGGILAVASDGVIRSLNSDLGIDASRYVGAFGAKLTTNSNANLAQLPLQSGDVLIMDTDTLALRQTVAPRPGSNLAQLELTADGTGVALLYGYMRYTTAGRYQDLTELRKSALASGKWPDLRSGEEDDPATIRVVPICTNCAPRPSVTPRVTGSEWLRSRETDSWTEMLSR